MKTKLFLLLFSMCIIGSYAQDLSFTFVNARNTNDGTNDYYEADIYIASSEDVKIGSGLLYFNYNTLAFGENVFIKGAGNFEFLQPEGSLLAEKHALFPLGLYKDFVTNNNIISRVAVSFQQSVAQDAMTTNIVTSTPRHLLSIKIKYENTNEDANVEFESAAKFTGQFFTACGGAVDEATNFGSANCTDFSGELIENDSFESSGAIPQTLGVDDLDEVNLSEITVYPNPVLDNVFIRGNTEHVDAIKIYNVTGLLVKHLSVESLVKPINVTNLIPGMYFLQLSSDYLILG